MFRKIWFDELDSTNKYLKRNYKNYNNFDCIIAKKQTNGIGRFDRKWISNQDITMSLLFKNSNYNHSIIVPLVIVKVLDDLGIKADIKWPNDILINNKKISGILVESIFEGNKKIVDIVGVGINMSQCIEYDSSGIDEFINIKKEELIDMFLNKYEELLCEDLFEEYNKRCFVIGKKVVYKNNLYTAIGITKDFELILKNEKEIIRINSQEIKIKEEFKIKNY